MSYSLVLLRRRLEVLENLPSARKPLVIRGGLPVGYAPPYPAPTSPKMDSVTKEPKAQDQCA